MRCCSSGIDIGGTFTDLALYDSDSDELASTRCARRPTTRAARWWRAIAELCELAGRRAGRPRRRPARDDGRDERGARAPGRATGLVTTAGMRDVVHIGRHQRPEPYSVMQDIPWQARAVRRSAEHRTRAGADRAADAARSSWRSTRTPCAKPGAARATAGVEAVAVCFLFSYLNPAHEQRAAEILPRRCRVLHHHERRRSARSSASSSASPPRR